MPYISPLIEITGCSGRTITIDVTGITSIGLDHVITGYCAINFGSKTEFSNMSISSVVRLVDAKRKEIYEASTENERIAISLLSQINSKLDDKKFTFVQKVKYLFKPSK
jgi:transcriptional antiterminator